jgi:hypothetical protein
MQSASLNPHMGHPGSQLYNHFMTFMNSPIVAEVPWEVTSSVECGPLWQKHLIGTTLRSEKQKNWRQR